MALTQLTTWTRCAPGPAAGHEGPVLVSFTDLTLARRRHQPGAALAGLRLRQGWYGMEGAVGLWLWSQPFRRRSGSLSVWTEPEHLSRFVGLPAHVAIMDAYRSRGELESASWEMDRFTASEALAEAERLIRGA